MTSHPLHVAGFAALEQGQLNAARSIGARAIASFPEHPASHFIAGVAALRLNELNVALVHLRRAVELAPERFEPLAELSRAYVTAGHVPEAVEAADRAMALSPSNGLILDMLGVIYGRTNFHEKAADAFRRAVELMPANGASRFNLASSLAFAGDIDHAEREFEACLAVDPRQWRAYLFRSQLRRQTAERNHIAELQHVLARARGAVPELYLHMALAKELEDLGDFPAAFDHLVKGKAAGGRGRGYASARDAALFQSITGSCAEPAAEGGGFDTDEPIFVIGMPRSGTTLVERILSSHPQVHSAGELRNFLVVLHRHLGAGQEFLLAEDLKQRLQGIDWEALGRDYVASTRPGTGHTPRFVDKLPHNFLHAGFIARALPNARIICLRRDPVDTCLSNFRQVFALESSYYDYSFDLLDTGRYYVLFDRLISHWQQVLPGRILELQYETLVEEQEQETRRLLAFCGLPWDEACLRFERNAAPVATASAVQVRSPMYRTAVQRWKCYEPQLVELRQLLQAAGIATG